MNAANPTPKRASPLQAFRAAFSQSLYFELVLSHNMASLLGSEQIASAFHAGHWPPLGWTEQALELAGSDQKKLMRSISMSALISALLTALAVLVAVLLGKVHPSLPLDPGKLSSSFGAALVAWAAFLQMMPARPSIRTDLLHEVSHGTLIRFLLIAGASFSAIGALWWQ